MSFNGRYFWQLKCPDNTQFIVEISHSLLLPSLWLKFVDFYSIAVNRCIFLSEGLWNLMWLLLILITSYVSSVYEEELRDPKLLVWQSRC